MSSKHAAAKGSQEALWQFLHWLDTGEWRKVPSHKRHYIKRYAYAVPTKYGYSLTPKGKRALSEGKIWDLTIPTPPTWDGKWRMVLFDIPVDKRKRRDSFRLRLKELGLVLYQNSVWIYPYPLEDTVRVIARFYKIEPCISFVTAEKISQTTSFEKQFGL